MYRSNHRIFWPVAHLVERFLHTEEAGRSKLPGPTIFTPYQSHLWACSSMVERCPDATESGGSTPPGPTNLVTKFFRYDILFWRIRILDGRAEFECAAVSPEKVYCLEGKFVPCLIAVSVANIGPATSMFMRVAGGSSFMWRRPAILRRNRIPYHQNFFGSDLLTKFCIG